jgi:hypothetical protein
MPQLVERVEFLCLDAVANKLEKADVDTGAAHLLNNCVPRRAIAAVKEGCKVDDRQILQGSARNAILRQVAVVKIGVEAR